ncbi:uncharacterized protein si:busm1-163l24.3 [Dicentrarchus labrax]|uniref:RING-type E3 ubiquitin transferase n=2 Tax=Dicentrarchus labrax TaxID=13489 RepID=A0A8P4KDE2_DICLA|nr:uncharacterized protein si:busm1-163l24.3 [Dicentrarchus labrax]
MAEPGRTVRVSGLPIDTEDNRLKDKLCIHFLRSRNGGGEIDSVTIIKATPVSALITFEDSRVAQRVIQQSRHILEVDGKNYKVTVTEHRESLDPDKVILNLSAMIDYSQLPGGAMALTSLHKSYPDIQIIYDATEELYTLHGAYSRVQAALAQLLDHPGGKQSAENKDTSQPATSGSKSIQTAPKPHTQESENQSRKPNRQREQREKVHIGRPSDEYESGSHRDLTPGGYGWDDTGQTEGAAMQLPGHPTASEEDFFLIVDADMFQYLQKHCQKEYQRILSQYGVDVVDVTNHGLTTLFLQVATEVGEDGQDEECLTLAKKAISRLYQENETKIRRAQLPKSIVSPRGGLQRAMENLSVRFPKLLMNEDDQNIYIIGSSIDVSEAKLFLLGHNEGRGKKEDVASLFRFPSYDSGSSTHADEQRVPLPTSSPVDSVDIRIDQPLRSKEDERRADGARRYKLAARFKDSGLPALGSRPTDFSLRGLSSPSRQTRRGPMVGHDVLSETAQIAGERASRALAQNTGGDILFKSGDALPSTAFMQNKTSLNSHLTDTRPKSLTSPVSTTQSSVSGSTPLPPAGSSTLKRASSFSGTPQEKAQVMGQKSQDDSGKSTVRTRARSSSFSNQTGRDKQEVYNAEITVSSVVWMHIKEAYSTRVDDLTSDVQMKERRSQGSSDLTITLRGASSSKVSSCQLGLQKLVASVSADFVVQELRLSELGITDRADENLQACCAEVRSRFKKVTIRFLEKRLFVLGPEQLCSQLAATLREVFSGDLAQIPEQQVFSTSNWNPSTLLQTNEGQSTSLRSNTQVMLQSQTSKANGTGSSQERRTNHRSDSRETEHVNGSISQPLVRKDPVIKEKVRIVSTVEMDGQKMFVSHSKTGSDESARHVNGVGSTTTRTDKDLALHMKERTTHSTQKDTAQQRQTDIQDTPAESRSSLGGLGCMCVCGENKKSTIRTKCGANFCSECLETVHVQCKVCHETEPTPRGIQGKMKYSKIHISVPGHKKDSAIKITYLIPDGIQEEGHPSPGKPFKGGMFEAFLPDCEKARKLLPRLEKAFEQGLTFTLTKKETGASVIWDCIPHKTSIHGGKSGSGYPDSTYLTRLSNVLTSYGIEEPPAES